MTRTVMYIRPLILFATALLPALVIAQTADELYKASAAAYKAQDYQRALKLLEQACAITPDDRCDYNAGRIYEKLGKVREAATRYKSAMERAVSSEVREKAEERLRVIIPMLPGRIGVRTEVSGARVLIDGKEVGTTPITPLEVQPGDHEVLLLHPEYDDTSARVKVIPDQEVVVTLSPTRAMGTVVVNTDAERGHISIDGGDKREVTFPTRVMLPVGVHKVAVSSTVGNGETAVSVRKGEVTQISVPLQAPAIVKPEPVVVAKQEPVPTIERPWWGWLLIGGGLAIVATGGALTFLAENDRASVTSAIDDIKNGRPPQGMTMAEAVEVEQAANNKALASYVLYGVGGVAAVTGAVILGVGLKVPAKVSVVPGSEGAAVTLHVPF